LSSATFPLNVIFLRLSCFETIRAMGQTDGETETDHPDATLNATAIEGCILHDNSQLASILTEKKRNKFAKYDAWVGKLVFSI